MTLKQRAENASKFIQNLVDTGHTTLPRLYDHTLPTGDKIPRLGISIYSDPDSVEALGNPSKINKTTGEVILQGTGLLYELQSFRMADKANEVIPITVSVDGVDYNAVSTQHSSDPNNFSKKDKILLAEVLISQNAEVSVEDRNEYQKQLMESRKNLRSQQSKVEAPKVAEKSKVLF